MRTFFGLIYSNHRPAKEGFQNILERYVEDGFIERAGAIDCMKLFWKKGLLALKGKLYSVKEGELASTPPEAWYDQGLYIFNWYARRNGKSNDINMLMNFLFTQRIIFLVRF